MSRLTGRARARRRYPSVNDLYAKDSGDDTYSRWSLAVICAVMVAPDHDFSSFGYDWDLCADEAEY